jgi:hypothetical protein
MLKSGQGSHPQGRVTAARSTMTAPSFSSRSEDMPPRLTLQQRIKQHEERAARLRTTLTEQMRKQDTRRKILTGASILARMETDSGLRQRVAEILHSNLTRPDDRELFADLLPGASGNGNPAS